MMLHVGAEAAAFRVKDAELSIRNYVPFRTARSAKRKKGGIITYRKHHIAPSTKLLFSNSNSYTEIQVIHFPPMDLILPQYQESTILSTEPVPLLLLTLISLVVQ